MAGGIKSIVEYSGIQSSIVDVECHITNGLPSIVIIGDASRPVDEAKERLRASFAKTNLNFPKKRITLNLSPADIPKNSTCLDLSMAVAILTESHQVDPKVARDYLFLGEIGLDGKLNPVRGLIGKIVSAKKQGIKKFYIPISNLNQALLIPGITVKPASTIKDVFLDLSNSLPLKEVKTGEGKLNYPELNQDYIDMSEISGQPVAKRALEIAASGHHNILLNGPPGTGKTMLAKAMCGILPRLERNEVLEVTHLHSLANGNFSSLVTSRPFRSPHHSTSTTALVGGGSIPRPGEATLAHRGVLFLDELPEFSRSSLEALRQPLEDGIVNISRVKDSASFPASFILAATQNPCPCGYFGSTSKVCTCSASSIYKYQRKISGPILDRIDLHLEVNDINHKKLLVETSPDSETKIIRSRIEAVYKIQNERLGSFRFNSSMTNKEIRQLGKLSSSAKEFLDNAAGKLSLSSRGYMRSIKVARTIADLANEVDILRSHIGEALQYRRKNTTPLS